MSTASTDGILRAGWPLAAALVFVAGPFAAAPAWSQVPVDAEGNPLDVEVVGEPASDAAAGTASEATVPAEDLLSAEALEELVGPIALYPDDLLAIVLPASAYPLQIVEAARFLDALEDDPDLKPDESWDDSVVALLNYPEVVKMMNEDLDWTYALGEAVVARQADVIDAIEKFRDRAYAAGNLKSDERQTVTRDDGVLEITPVSDEVIYVPYYEPERVVVYQPQPVYHYYARPCPVYYYPYPYGYTFASGYFWGVTTAFQIGWISHNVHVFHPSYWGHPYYGRPYVFDRWWYRRPSIRVHNTFYVDNSNRHRPPHHERDGDLWRPRRHGGADLHHRGFRQAYYTDRRQHSDTGYTRDVARNRAGGGAALRDDAARRARNQDQGARLTRNRAGADLRERARGDVARRAGDRDDAIRFRTRDRADAARQAGDDAIRFRTREQAGDDAIRFRTRERVDPAGRAGEDTVRLRTRERADAGQRGGDDAIRFRPRERSTVIGRELSRGATGRDAVERPSTSRAAERSLSRPSQGTSRPAPRVSRPSSVSRPAPHVTRPSSVSRPAPHVSRPSSVSRPAPHVSRPSSVSRPAPHVSRPSAPSRSSSSSQRSRPAPASPSGTRRHNRD